MKEYTAEDVLDDYYKDDGSRCLTFAVEDAEEVEGIEDSEEGSEEDTEMVYVVRIESITLQLTEEIEKNGGGPVAEFAAQMLNRDMQQIQDEKDFKDAFEEISD